ncbi:hypothetical protein [Mangrovitalea sediminis]|uniref:hypothetical protein n=1 Tax=Mangrovitalea sediminis TaxID=1982043 RepID=UPI001178A436|nr:hypothetical protein [Mangrovitalea sediminis]
MKVAQQVLLYRARTRTVDGFGSAKNKNKKLPGARQQKQELGACEPSVLGAELFSGPETNASGVSRTRTIGKTVALETLHARIRSSRSPYPKLSVREQLKALSELLITAPQDTEIQKQ